MDNQQVMITEDEAIGLQIPLATYLKQHLDRGYKVQYSYEHEAVGTVYILDKEEESKEERMYTLEEMIMFGEFLRKTVTVPSNQYPAWYIEPSYKSTEQLFDEFLKTL